jgi:hypothetical protein
LATSKSPSLENFHHISFNSSNIFCPGKGQAINALSKTPGSKVAFARQILTKKDQSSHCST